MMFDFLVVIGTLDRPAFLPEAVLSALDQTGVTTKVVVVDDSATGSAEATVARMGRPEVLYVKNPDPSNGGPGRPRNNGVKAALKAGVEARFAHFLDDDDIVPPGYYAKAKRILTDNPNAGVLVGVLQAFVGGASDKVRPELFADRLAWMNQIYRRRAYTGMVYRWAGGKLGSPAATNWLLGLHAMYGKPFFMVGASIIRFEHYVALGGFGQSGRIMEDLPFFERAVRTYGAISSPQIGLFFRLSESSMTQSLVIDPAAKVEEVRKINESFHLWQNDLRRETGGPLGLRHYIRKATYKLVVEPLVERFIVPRIDKRLDERALWVDGPKAR